ncbi:MAG: hypothetical protein H7839_05920 [Magnetococcus sp. YQC-5]
MSRAKCVDAALQQVPEKHAAQVLDCVLFGQPESGDPTDEQLDVSKIEDIVRQGMSLQEALSTYRFPLNGCRFDRDDVNAR